MINSKTLRPIAYCLLLLLLSSCAGRHVPPRTGRPWTPAAKLRSFSAWAEVELEIKGRAESFQAALLAEGPNRLRIQILDDLGQERALLIANGTQVFWWSRHEGDPRIYPQDPKVLKKTLKLPLNVQEFIARLLEGTEAENGKKKSYRIVVEDITETDAGSFPLQWTWYFSKPRATLSVLFSHLRLNPRLQPDQFDF